MVTRAATSVLRGMDAGRRLQVKRMLTPVVCRAMRGNLIVLARLFGSDKWGRHFYAQHYQTHFARLRRRRLRILEVGVGGYCDPLAGGESLRMWKWFFPRGRVFGVDIEDKRQIAEDRIAVFQGDQSDPQFLAHVVGQMGGVDIVIDDGSHVNEHVITTFHVLFPLLSPEGVYAIEDMQTSYWKDYGGCPDPPGQGATSVNLVRSLINGLNYEEYKKPAEVTDLDRSVYAVHVYHNLAIIQKGRNQEGGRAIPRPRA